MGSAANSQQLTANEHTTNGCIIDSAASLQTGHTVLTGTFLIQRRSLVGKQLFTDLQRKFLTFGGIFRFHNFLQKSKLSYKFPLLAYYREM